MSPLYLISRQDRRELSWWKLVIFNIPTLLPYRVSAKEMFPHYILVDSWCWGWLYDIKCYFLHTPGAASQERKVCLVNKQDFPGGEGGSELWQQQALRRGLWDCETVGPETCVGVGTWEGLQGWAGPLFYINNKQRAGQVTPETRKLETTMAEQRIIIITIFVLAMMNVWLDIST